MIRLLRLLRQHPDAVEADLQRFYGTDLRDLGDRSKRLTYRRLLSFIRNLPPDSAVARRQGGEGWTTTDYLIADIYASLVGKFHPADPRARRTQSAVADAQLRAGLDRARARRKALGIRGSVLRAPAA